MENTIPGDYFLTENPCIVLREQQRRIESANCEREEYLVRREKTLREIHSSKKDLYKIPFGAEVVADGQDHSLDSVLVSCIPEGDEVLSLAIRFCFHDAGGCLIASLTEPSLSGGDTICGGSRVTFRDPAKAKALMGLIDGVCKELGFH